MNKPINTGGPAYPQLRGSDMTLEDEQGMTLRDWFAGMAMQGMFAADMPEWSMPLGHEHQRAQLAYAMADAMIYHRTAHKKDNT